MKRIVGIFSLLVFLIGMFSSCSGTAAPSSGPEEEPEEQIDLMGLTLICSTHWDLFGVVDHVGMIEGDRILYKVNLLEKECNCNLEDDWNGWGHSGNYMSAVMSGQLKYHLTVQLDYPSGIEEMVRGDLVVPLDDYDFFDFSNEKLYGDAVAKLPVSFDGKIYAVRGDIKPRSGFLVYNKPLADDFGVADPQELYEKREWTFQTFQEMLPSVTDDSDPAFRIFGLSQYSEDMLGFTAVFANGGGVLKPENGKMRYALTDSDAVEALTWANELCRVNSLGSADRFEQGQSTFYLTQSWHVAYAMKSDAIGEIDYIPFPFGPSAEYGVTKAAYYGPSGGTLIFTGEYTEESAAVLGRYIAFDDYPEDLQIDENYDRVNNYYNDKSYENYLFSASGGCYNYAAQLGSQSYNNIVNAITSCTVNGKGVSESVTRIEDSIQLAAETITAP